MGTETQNWTDSQKDIVEKLNEAFQKVIDGNYDKLAKVNAAYAKEYLDKNELVFVCYYAHHTVYGILLPGYDLLDKSSKEFVKELIEIRRTFEKEFDVEYPDTEWG